MDAPQPLAGFSPSSGAAAGEVEFTPAKFSDRFIAYFIDILPFLAGYGASIFVIVVKLQTAPPTPVFFSRLGALFGGLAVLYQFIGNLSGGTVGKRLMGLRVVRRDGQPLGFVRSLLRALGWALSTPLCNFGFLIALFHPETRTLHDLISGSLVIETRAKNMAESFILFLAALCAVAVLFFGNIFFGLAQPTRTDLLAVEKAQEGILILAHIEEEYKAKNGAYTKSIADLAAASGDVEAFKKAMLGIFDPNLFRLEAGMGQYKISAAAKDRAKTRVSIQGPLPPGTPRPDFLPPPGDAAAPPGGGVETSSAPAGPAAAPAPVRP